MYTGKYKHASTFRPLHLVFVLLFSLVVSVVTSSQKKTPLHDLVRQIEFPAAETTHMACSIVRAHSEEEADEGAAVEMQPIIVNKSIKLLSALHCLDAVLLHIPHSDIQNQDSHCDPQKICLCNFHSNYT